MITVRDVTFRYAGTPVVDAVSFTVARGELLCIIGANGAGKTTLLRLISGSLVPERGSVLLAGEETRASTPRARAMVAAMVPQMEPVVLPVTVRSAVLMGRYPHLSGFGFERAEDHAAADEAMRLCGVDELAERAVTQLSGGEQHRVLMARALAQATPLLLLDEPNAHLDLRHQKQLFELLCVLKRRHGKTIVCVTHDLNLAAAYADRILVMDHGGVAADGPPADVLTPALILRHFGVHVERVALHNGGFGLYVLPSHADEKVDRP